MLHDGRERMQAERQPQFPLLYSVQGFQYADLLLAPAINFRNLGKGFL